MHVDEKGERGAPPPNNACSLASIGIDRLNGGKEYRLDPEFVNRRNEYADVVRQHLTESFVNLPRIALTA